MGGAPAALAANGLFHIYRDKYSETVALRDVALTLEPGSWTSLMGPSGSGKSTLIHVLAGLLEPNGGSVVIDDRDITRLPASERTALRRNAIGLVLQRENLHPLLDAEGNISLPLRLDGRPRREIRTRVRELVARVGLDAHLKDSTTGQLSGGEAQRVAIAIAMVAQPRVILADEPTGELDEQTAAGVLDLLDVLRTEEGVAILTVTHNPQVAERAERRLRMTDGTVADEHE